MKSTFLFLSARDGLPVIGYKHPLFHQVDVFVVNPILLDNVLDVQPEKFSVAAGVVLHVLKTDNHPDTSPVWRLPNCSLIIG